MNHTHSTSLETHVYTQAQYASLMVHTILSSHILSQLYRLISMYTSGRFELGQMYEQCTYVVITAKTGCPGYVGLLHLLDSNSLRV